MNPKEILYASEATDKIVAGVNKLADAVKVTLGPMGRNVIIGHGRRAPHITKDGVTVAKEVALKDPFENMAAMMVKQAASKSAEVAGDGTTTTTVLTQAIVNIGFDIINKNPGCNVIQVARVIGDASHEIIQKIKELAIPCDNIDMYRQVALISSNGDSVIADTVAEAFDKVGGEGMVFLKDGERPTDELSFSNGIGIEHGYTSPYFVNSDTGDCVFDTCRVLLCDDEISSWPVELDKVFDGTPLVVIAPDFSNDFVASMVNSVRNGHPVCLVKAPGFGERRIDFLDDIALLSGATTLGSKIGVTWDDMAFWHAGTLAGIRATRFATTLTVVPNPELGVDIEKRKKLIRVQMDETSNDFYIASLQQRLAKLSGGVCTIKVGATTAMELAERKDRYDDAIRAVRSAIKAGIVAGGGCTLARLAEDMGIIPTKSTDDLELGYVILKGALYTPLRTILINAGVGDQFDQIVNTLNEVNETAENYVYDVRKGVWGTPLKTGIIDPALVTITALEAAVSVASLILTTACVMTETPMVVGEPTIGNQL